MLDTACAFILRLSFLACQRRLCTMFWIGVCAWTTYALTLKLTLAHFPSIFPSLSLVSLRRFPFCLARGQAFFQASAQMPPEAYIAF
jgi:hypothetical protein